MIRVLVVDDHSAFRQPLAFMLEREPDIMVVGQAASGAEVRQLLSDVDVALVDLHLADGSGIDVIAELSATYPDCAAVVLTASSDPQELAQAVAAGAAGVLHKSLSITDIIGAVRRVGAGEHLISAKQVREMIRVARDVRTQNHAAQAALKSLTAREREVLQALAAGLNDKEIAQRLHISPETARTHMVNILGKLGVTSRLQALVFALRHGAITIERG